MDQGADAGWNEVFGPGVVAIGTEEFGVARVEASVGRDFRVRLRFLGVRAEHDPIELDGQPAFDTRGFSARSLDGEPVVVRRFEPADAAWVSIFGLADVTIEQIEAIARAYGSVEEAEDEGPWGEWDEPVEFLRLLIDADRGRASLCYEARPWLSQYEPLRLRWTSEGWTALAAEPVGEPFDVHPQMVPTITDALEQGMTIRKPAALLAGSPAESTVVGQDPFEGVVRRRMRPELEAEVRRLLEATDRFPAEDPDVEYARWLLAGYDGPDRMAWTEEVFGVLTRLATAMDRTASHDDEEETPLTHEWISTVQLGGGDEDGADDVIWRLDVLRVGGPGSRRHWWPMTLDEDGDPRMQVFRDERGHVCRVVVQGEGPLDGAARDLGLDYMVFGSPTLFGAPDRGWAWRFSDVGDPFPFARGRGDGAVDD